MAEVDDWLELAGLDASGARDPARPAWVDMTSLADYMLANLYLGSDDWPHHNYYVARPRDGRLGFQFYMWDSEVSVGLRSPLDADKTGVDTGVAQPWAALRENPEFRLRVADRAQRHLLTPGGALWVDPENPEDNVPAERMRSIRARVAAGLGPESARWGDQHRPDLPYTPADADTEAAELQADYFPHRSARFLTQLRNAGLLARIPAPVPSRLGGPAAPGEVVTIEAAEGVVWYTLDGADPRRPGGARSDGAVGGEPRLEVLLADAPGAVLLRARAEVAGEWSAESALRLVVGGR